MIMIYSSAHHMHQERKQGSHRKEHQKHAHSDNDKCFVRFISPLHGKISFVEEIDEIYKCLEKADKRNTEASHLQR